MSSPIPDENLSSAHSRAWPGAIRFGPWQFDPESGELARDDGRSERLEPRLADLLREFLARPDAVLTRDELLRQVWPGMVLGEDALARAVSRLRRVLDDDARTPVLIETLHRRGYRWIGPTPQRADAGSTADPDSRSHIDSLPLSSSPSAAPAFVRARRSLFAIAVAGLLVASGMLAWRAFSGTGSDAQQSAGNDSADADARIERAEDFYFRYTRDGNEAAIALFEGILARDPDNASALAGLANALVQRVMRWPDPPGPEAREYTRLGDALAAGHLATRAALAELDRAEWLARSAVRVAPQLPSTHKALGLVLSARGRFDDAMQAYRRSIELDPDAWGAMINLGDVLDIQGRVREAIPHFEQAYDAMGRVYDAQTPRVQPWYSELAVSLGDRHRAIGDPSAAERWYRRALAHRPLHPTATVQLAQLLSARGDVDAARALCETLEQRVARAPECPVSAGEPR